MDRMQIIGILFAVSVVVNIFFVGHMWVINHVCRQLQDQIDEFVRKR